VVIRYAIVDNLVYKDTGSDNTAKALSQRRTYSKTRWHEVVAVDDEGSVLFDTESLKSHEVDTALTRGPGYPEGDDAPEGVDHYEIREK